LRSLLESTGEGVFGEDALGHCTFVNQAACDMLGLAKDEVIGRPISEILQPGRAEDESDLQQAYPVTHDWVTDDEVRRELFTRKDGSRFPAEAATHPIIDQDQTQGAVTVFRDVTKRQAWSRKMHDLANHDHLTHLLNRFAFEKLLQSVLEKVKRDGGESVLCYMDLDQFKVVNDTCGHAAGDAMLRLLAQTLSRNIKTTGKLARLGGDEFGLMLTSCTLEDADQQAKKLCDVVKEFRFTWHGKSFTTGINIGVVGITPESADVSSLLSSADAACYLAKEMGRNIVYVSRTPEQVLGDWRGEVQWAADIQLAMLEQRLELHCQSIERLDRRTADGSFFELLLRMTDDNGDVISPKSFIPSAERYDQMIKLDRWVINQAFQWLADDRQRMAGISLCTINLSAQSLLDKSLYEYIINELRRHDLPANKICFEINETAVVSRLDRCVVLMGLLKEMGFRFALDDFGVGMSSFSYLKTLPMDFLKIDGSIVMNILEDPVNRAMVESINNIAHLMGLQTIAKFVENDWIRFELKKIGVDYVQGFGVARPEPLLDAIGL
jgi:diguanylate cyclase (GGDEF)-like protein/PAS domain S-box-containing protein